MVILAMSFFSTALAQQNGVIQLSGVVLSNDTLTPVPFANVIIKGVMTDYYGFFSIPVKENDEIIFSAMGFKNSTFIVPDTLTLSRYSLIQIITPDTIYLKEAVIYPWATYEQFKKAFIQAVIPDDNYEKAIKNFTMLMNMKEQWAEYPDANFNYNNFVYQKVSKLYYAGQLPPNNLLNPFAWASFINAWKEGKLNLRKED